MPSPSRVAVTVEQCWHRVPGGTASSALGSLRALQAHTDLDLVGLSARHRTPAPPPWRPPVPVRALPLPRLALYEAWHRLRWPPVERATGPVDVIHATGMAVPPRSAPLVVTVHDLAFLDEPDLFTSRGVRFFHRCIELARRDADLVVCPSQATIDRCIAEGFEPQRLRLVPWGIDIDPAPAEAVAAARRRFGVERPYILWNGTIEPRKNVPVLVDAFGRLGRDDLDLVLAGPEGWNDELDRIAAGIDGTRIHRTGFVAADELRALHAGAEVFAFPSRVEGFGLPVLEAMSQGTPVVTSSGTATAEVVGDSEAGLLVPPGDPAALAEALAAVVDDPDERARRAKAARARAGELSWARTAEALAAAYEEARAS
jgi:glycosyltransferase involved in cell wall biosynthesis